MCVKVSDGLDLPDCQLLAWQTYHFVGDSGREYLNNDN